MHITRRDWLALAAAFPSAVRAFTADAMDETVARASDAIRSYSAEGFHRTATAVDRASADWLLGLAKTAGASPRHAPFELARVDPAAQFVEIDGRRIDGLVMFDAPFTAADGVVGAL